MWFLLVIEMDLQCLENGIDYLMEKNILFFYPHIVTYTKHNNYVYGKYEYDVDVL